jgi:ankyrin repeat protein
LFSFPDVDYNRLSNDGDTLLINACGHGNIPMVNKLLSFPDINYNYVNTHGDNALITACEFESDAENTFVIVNKLLSLPNVDYNHANKDGMTALMYTCEYNDTTNVGYVTNINNMSNMTSLLKMPNINYNYANNSGETALMCAVRNDSICAVTKLLSLPNIDYNHINNDGYSALDLVVMNDTDEEIIMTLFELPDVVYNHETFAKTIFNNLNNLSIYAYIASKLIQNKNIDCNYILPNGDSLLMTACVLGKWSLVYDILNTSHIKCDHIDSNGESILTLLFVDGCFDEENDDIYYRIVRNILKKSDINYNHINNLGQEIQH